MMSMILKSTQNEPKVIVVSHIYEFIYEHTSYSVVINDEIKNNLSIYIFAP